MNAIQGLELGRYSARPESRAGERALVLCVLFTIATLGAVIATAVRKNKNWELAISLGVTAGTNLLLGVFMACCCDDRQAQAPDPADNLEALRVMRGLPAHIPTTRRERPGPIPATGKACNTLKELTEILPASCSRRAIVYGQVAQEMPPGWTMERIDLDDSAHGPWVRLTERVRAALVRGDSVLIKSVNHLTPSAFLDVQSVRAGSVPGETSLFALWENEPERPFSWVADFVLVIVPSLAASPAASAAPVEGSQ